MLLQFGFSILALLRFGAADNSSRGGGLPVHCEMFSSIPGIYPLDVSKTPLPLPPLMTGKEMSTDIASMFPRGQNHPQLITTDLRAIWFSNWNNSHQIVSSTNQVLCLTPTFLMDKNSKFIVSYTKNSLSFIFHFNCHQSYLIYPPMPSLGLLSWLLI